MIDKTVVKELDIQKYLGTWYEIARYDHRFERGLVGVTAKYSMRDDGKIKVVNSGYKDSLDGKFSQAVGKAKIPDPVNDPAKLKVSFFWFFLWRLLRNGIRRRLPVGFDWKQFG